jgi:hypothetical protein
VVGFGTDGEATPAVDERFFKCHSLWPPTLVGALVQGHWRKSARTHAGGYEH